MANEISKYYTCISHTTNTSNNEKLIKNHSLPTNVIASSFNSCISFQTNPHKNNESNIKNDNNIINKNQKECSEMIVETQQKLQNLKLESHINTLPIDLYSKFIKEENLKNKISFNYTEIINNEKRSNKRKLNFNANSIVCENERSFKKQYSCSPEKISEIKKLRSSNISINNTDNSNQINNPNEISEHNNNNNNNDNNNNNSPNLKYSFNINPCEINKNNNVNNVNIINMKHNVKDNINFKLQKNNYEYSSDDDSDEESDYKKINRNLNNADCWGILQSINPKFSTIYLKKSNFNNECTIGRNKKCNIWINIPQVSGHHCRIYYTETKSKITGCITREFFLQDMSSYGTFVNETLVGKGNTVNLYNGQSIDLYKSRNKEKFFIFLVPNNGIVPEKSPEVGYTICNDIGSGSFGRVCKGIRKSDNLEVAIKIVNKSKLNSKPGANLMKYLEREVNILKSIQHENIIQLFDVYEDSTNVYLVLELAKGGELLSRIKLFQKLNENQTRIVMKQLFSALEYLHSQGIAHRDLKPENILMISRNSNNFSIKLSDFGLSRFVDDNLNMRTLCGTPNYTAPEVFDKNIKNYTIAVDMWSCGVIMYICLCGYPPFSRRNSKYPLKTQILNGLYSFKPEHWSNVSPEAISLIKSLLQVNPENRLNVSQALNHPFFKNDDSMQIDYEYKRKRRIQTSNNEQSAISSKSESESTADIDYSSSFSSTSNNNNINNINNINIHNINDINNNINNVNINQINNINNNNINNNNFNNNYNYDNDNNNSFKTKKQKLL